MGNGLFMTLLVRDEADIILQNIEYHLRHGVEHIIVTDNGSVDGTRFMLEHGVPEGRVTVIDQPSHTYEQAKWVSHMNYVARLMGAKYIINADADEFWTAQHTGNLIEEFEARPEVQAFSVPLQNVALVRNETGTESFPYDTYALFSASLDAKDPTEKRCCSNGKGIWLKWPPKVMYRVQNRDMIVEQGNHAVRGLDPVGATRTRVVHFPYRSKEQYLRKVTNGGSAYANSNLPEGMGYHWREWYAKLQDSGLEEEYLGEISLSWHCYQNMLQDGEVTYLNALHLMNN
jgi:hypothetical protein